MFYRLLIEYTEDKGNDTDAWKGYVYVVCFVVVQAFQVSLVQHSLHVSFTSAMRVHTSIIGVVYNKVKGTPLITEMMKVNYSNIPSHDGNCISCFSESVLLDSLNAGHLLLKESPPNHWYYAYNHAVPPHSLFYRYPLPFVAVFSNESLCS